MRVCVALDKKQKTFPTLFHNLNGTSTPSTTCSAGAPLPQWPSSASTTRARAPASLMRTMDDASAESTWMETAVALADGFVGEEGGLCVVVWGDRVKKGRSSVLGVREAGGE